MLLGKDSAGNWQARSRRPSPRYLGVMAIGSNLPAPATDRRPTKSLPPVRVFGEYCVRRNHSPPQTVPNSLIKRVTDEYTLATC